MKDIIVNTMLVAILGGGLTAGKFYGDNTYISMNAYQEANAQTRIWALQDQIKVIERNAAREDRVLTTLERQDIKELQTEIDNLKGE